MRLMQVMRRGTSCRVRTVLRGEVQEEAEAFALSSAERLWALVVFSDGPHPRTALSDYTIRCAGLPGSRHLWQRLAPTPELDHPVSLGRVCFLLPTVVGVQKNKFSSGKPESGKPESEPDR